MGASHVNGETVFPIEVFTAEVTSVDKLTGEVNGLDVVDEVIFPPTRLATGFADEISRIKTLLDVFLQRGEIWSCGTK